MALEVDRGAVTLVTRYDGVESRVPVGYGAWGRSVLMPKAIGGRDERVAATGAWTAEDTYTAQLAFHETPYVITLALRFKGDEVSFDREWNVAFGERKAKTLVGRAEPVAPRARKRPKA